MKIAPSVHRLAWVLSALLIGALVLPFGAASGALLPLPAPGSASAPKVTTATLTVPTVKVPVLPAPPLVQPPTVPPPPVVKLPAPPPKQPAPSPPPPVKVPVVPSPPVVKTPLPPVPPAPKVTPTPIPVPKVTLPGTGTAPAAKPPTTVSGHAPTLAGPRPIAPAGSRAGGLSAASAASTSGHRLAFARARAAGGPTRPPGGTAVPAGQGAVPSAAHGAAGPSATWVAPSASLPAAVQAAKRTPSGGGWLPGISIPAAAGSILLLIILTLAGLLGFGLLSAEGVVPWDLRRRWHSSWLHHHPWNWHG